MGEGVFRRDRACPVRLKQPSFSDNWRLVTCFIANFTADGAYENAAKTDSYPAIPLPTPGWKKHPTPSVNQPGLSDKKGCLRPVKAGDTAQSSLDG
jgi:hypothetical protein